MCLSFNFIRFLLFGINLLCLIKGIILITIGATVLAIYEGYENVLASNFFRIPAVLIAIGTFIFIIAFFGCCGAIKENYCMLYTYLVLLIIIFILELTIGIAAYVLRDEANKIIESKLNSSLKYYGKEKHKDITQMWDQMQKKFHCCGTHDYKDWSKVMPNKELPDSCCKFPKSQEDFVCKANNDNKYLHKEGCLEKSAHLMKSHMIFFCVVAIVLASVQLIKILCAHYIAKKLKNSYISEHKEESHHVE